MHSTSLSLLCILGLAGSVVSEVSVDFDKECNAENQDCSEDTALMQTSWPKEKGGEVDDDDTKGGDGGTCRPITHSCSKKRKVAGFLYTATNSDGENKVIAFDKNWDGTLGRQRVYGTGSRGGSNTSRAGPLRGDYNSQGGMQIIGEYLLVVNGGGNTVSTFRMCHDGSLEHIRNVPSGGELPSSITYWPKKDQSEKWSKGGKPKGEEYWVVVANQWAFPVALKNPDNNGADGFTSNLVFFPNESFWLDHLYAKENPQQNIFCFSFSTNGGKLTPERVIETYSSNNGGPITVSFNEDGTKLAMATAGLPHDGVAKQIQKLKFQRPSRLYVWDFDSKTADVSNRRYWESCGDSGFVGFSWLKDRLYVAAFNSVNEHGLKVFSDSGTRLTLEQELVSNTESCWTCFHPSNKFLYVANFIANTLAAFGVDDDGVVSDKISEVERENTMPGGKVGGDTKEMWIDSKGKNFYVQGTGFSFVLAHYDIKKNGGLELTKEYKIDELIGAENYSSNLLGFAGFEYCEHEW